MCGDVELETCICVYVYVCCVSVNMYVILSYSHTRGNAELGALGQEFETKSRTLPVPITSHEYLTQGRPILAIAAGADTTGIIVSHLTDQLPQTPASRHPLPMSFHLNHYTQLLTTCYETRDWTQIMSYVSSVWSDPMALNASFMMRTVCYVM